MKDILRSIVLLIVLLNPFLIIVYLVDVIKKKPLKKFGSILIRAGIISVVVFSVFALLGDIIFSSLFQARFASFQIFGGVIFLLIGIQFIFKGSAAIETLRGESKYIAGAIVMPIFIGPGTLSYCIIIGQKLDKIAALLSIGLTVLICISIIYFLKLIYDRIHEQHEELVEKYFDVAGRITALVIGTISIEMIMQGLNSWIQRV